MRKLKINVYAIAKNEEQFVKRWVNSMKEADNIYVLDTGSTDNTVKELKELGVNVAEESITPWRFDVARNKSLELLPDDTDICVCTDLDEVLLPGWRKKLEESWQENTTRLYYTYNWLLDEHDNPKVSFNMSKIHTRKHYKWTHPVHEVLEYEGIENIVTNTDIILNHYPDKNKSRGSYLKLLELSVKEDPKDDRNMHYLGREYMYYGKWQECIDTLIKHLNLKTAVWKDERCASMRFIARSYKNLNRYDEARLWLNKAIEEAPYLRDPYMEMALLEYILGNFKEVEIYTLKALQITTKEKTYINEIFSWDYTPYDLLSISYYYQNRKDEALYYINKALSLDKDNERLLTNKEIISNMNKK